MNVPKQAKKRHMDAPSKDFLGDILHSMTNNLNTTKSGNIEVTHRKPDSEKFPEWTDDERVQLENIDDKALEKIYKKAMGIQEPINTNIVEEYFTVAGKDIHEIKRKRYSENNDAVDDRSWPGQNEDKENSESNSENIAHQAKLDAERIVGALWQKETEITRMDPSSSRKKDNVIRKFDPSSPRDIVENLPLYSDLGLERYDQVLSVKLLKRLDVRKRYMVLQKGIGPKVLVFDKHPTRSRCYVASKSYLCSLTEVRGASSVWQVLQAYAWSQSTKIRQDYHMFVLDGENEKVLLDGPPITNAVYTVGRVPKYAKIPKHYYYDPITNNQKQLKLDKVLEQMLGYSDLDFFLVKQKICSQYKLDWCDVSNSVDQSMKCLKQIFKNLETTNPSTTYYENVNTKLLTSLEFQLHMIEKVILVRIFRPSSKPYFSSEATARVMEILKKFSGGDSFFGLKYLFYMLKKHGLSLTDVICHIALRNYKDFVKQITCVMGLGHV